MVMEMPSPQCVGQEFVRQYYTLLHQAPEHMHRYFELVFVIQLALSTVADSRVHVGLYSTENDC